MNVKLIDLDSSVVIAEPKEQDKTVSCVKAVNISNQVLSPETI